MAVNRKFELMSKGMGDDRLPIEVIIDQFKAEGAHDYFLLDTGEGRKLEQVGPYILDRQCPVAFWSKNANAKLWAKADAVHQRSEEGGGFWETKTDIGTFWFTRIGRIAFKTKLTAFGHLGFFVEQAAQWDWLTEKLNTHHAKHAEAEPLKILNLFGYTGGASIACAMGGAQVTHVDAARGVVDWARQNAAVNKIHEGAIRYAVEDCKVFLDREAKRGNFYNGVILDPPSFGRGPNKEVFKIEEDIVPLLAAVKKVLSPNPNLFHFTSHSPGFSAEVLKNLAAEIIPIGSYAIDSGEMLMSERATKRRVPSGQYLRLWK